MPVSTVPVCKALKTTIACIEELPGGANATTSTEPMSGAPAELFRGFLGFTV